MRSDSLLHWLQPLRQLAQAAAYRRFLENTDQNLFWGVFDSFDAAAAAAPATRPLGYDNEASAQLYVPQIYSFDYPALFWIGRSFDDGLHSVFDLGGHVGIKHYAFRRLLHYPDDLRWTVCDVPAVVERGRMLALQKAPGGKLVFTTDFRAASGFDVLLASGSLQYLPLRIGQMLAEMPVKPRRIVLNVTALHPSRTYYTLNSIGTAFCPYRVQAHDELVAELVSHGYRRRDEWENWGKVIHVPLTTDHDVQHYTGFCFDLG